MIHLKCFDTSYATSFEFNYLAHLWFICSAIYDKISKKGKILISGIGRTGLVYKVIKSPEHSGFEELAQSPKKIFGNRPRNQFGLLAKNAVDCVRNYKAKPFCDDYESLVDMIVIDGLLKSSKKGGIKVKIKKLKK